MSASAFERNVVTPAPESMRAELEQYPPSEEVHIVRDDDGIDLYRRSSYMLQGWRHMRLREDCGLKDAFFKLAPKMPVPLWGEMTSLSYKERFFVLVGDSPEEFGAMVDEFRGFNDLSSPDNGSSAPVEAVVTDVLDLIEAYGGALVIPRENGQEIFRRSEGSDKWHSMVIDVDPDKAVDFLTARRGTFGPIQDVFPDVAVPTREFLLSGRTPEEWTEMFGPPPPSDGDAAPSP